MNRLLDHLGRELSKPVNPAAAPLGIGYVLTDEQGALYLICGMLNEAFRLVRLPPGMGINDLGRQFRHAPTPDDPAASEEIR